MVPRTNIKGVARQMTIIIRTVACKHHVSDQELA
jgi:hypothetical protein